MKISPEELQQLKDIELEILDVFIRICNKHNIKYFISDGTCLGAIRHGGFIPWDDDIDVSMLREDYERFCEICHTELPDKFALQNYHTEPNCGLVFAKIRKKGTVLSEDYSHHIEMSQGVWIDIFPYDAVPNNRAELKRLERKVSFLKNLYIVKCGYKMPPNMSTVGKIAYYGAKLVCLFIPKSILINALEKNMRSHEGEATENVYPYGGAYGIDREIVPKKLCENTATIDFEGRLCLTYENYKEYLELHYGNYMELPPVEKRVGGTHRIEQFIAHVE